MNINQTARAKPETSCDFRDIASAWKILHDRVGLGQIRNERQYKNMVAVGDKLVDEIVARRLGKPYGPTALQIER